ncbi:hypothetical protein BKA70DRAFT_670883 [Coprinopsis sp. MPI-PUGE-AT-0042]|nr:hypothetical protein BKA70DRAFT_670883 [Coprinopsis sp. MPI-PUGE-AT-0042]
MLRSGPTSRLYTEGESFIDFSSSTETDLGSTPHRLLNRAADALQLFLLRLSAVVASIIHFLQLLHSSTKLSSKMKSQRGFNTSVSCILPLEASKSASSETLPSSKPTGSPAIPPHFTRRVGSRSSSRQSSTASENQKSASFFRRMLSIPFKSRTNSRSPFHHGRSVSVQTSIVSFTIVDTSSFDDCSLSGRHASPSSTDVDSDCEMVEYVSDDDSPTTLSGPSPILDNKLRSSPSTPTFSNPFSSSEPILSPMMPLAQPPQPKKKTPRRNPHQVQHLSDFIATRRTSALMCPPPSPGFSTTTTARRRSSCKGSAVSGLPSPHPPYHKWYYATEDSRHDASPRRTSYVAETSVASLPIPPWRRFRKVPPGDVESQREAAPSPATSTVTLF